MKAFDYAIFRNLYSVEILVFRLVEKLWVNVWKILTGSICSRIRKILNSTLFSAIGRNSHYGKANFCLSFIALTGTTKNMDWKVLGFFSQFIFAVLATVKKITSFGKPSKYFAQTLNYLRLSIGKFESASYVWCISKHNTLKMIASGLDEDQCYHLWFNLCTHYCGRVELKGGEVKERDILLNLYSTTQMSHNNIITRTLSCFVVCLTCQCSAILNKL